MEIKWYHKFLLRFWPSAGIKYLAIKQGNKNRIFGKLHNCLVTVKRVDFFPFLSNERGFMIVLDNEISLWFLQNGDYFIYDGFEIGKYNNGEVTVFEN